MTPSDIGADPARCSVASRLRDDVRAATAPPAQRLLLVENSGPWGRDALRESSIDPGTGSAIVAQAAAAGARVLLIRRVGRAGTRSQGRWALVDARPSREATWWGTYGDERELLELPLDGSVGERSERLTYLVCTHGRHDTCCAIWGRPVAAALAVHRPEDTWECSHVGGDRFAANVVVAPYGLYYGHVQPTEVRDFVETCEAGLVQESHLRGRTVYPAAVQAAQHYARLHLDERRIAALAPLQVWPREGDHWHVRLSHDSGIVDVVVAASMTAVGGRLTCAAVRPGHVRAFALRSLEIEPLR